MSVTLTISLSTARSSTLADLALLLQIKVPGLFLSVAVLEGERDDSLGLLDGVFTLRGVGLEGGVDEVEGGGGGEGFCLGMLVSGWNKAEMEGKRTYRS